MGVAQYLKQIDEMDFLANKYGADFFLNHKYAVTAYKFWATKKDVIVKNSKLSELNNMNSLVGLDLPFYSGESKSEFIKIINGEESSVHLRQFLSDCFNGISNLDGISSATIRREIAREAQEKISLF